MVEEYANYVGGKWVKSESGQKFEVRNPTRPSQLLGYFQLSSRGDVHAAVASARRGIEQWTQMSPLNRGKLLYRAAQILQEESDQLSRELTMEEGKTLKESQGEVQRAIDIFLFYAGLAPVLDGKTIPSGQKRTFIHTRREPMGVVAIVTPWNFPIAIPAWKIAPALVSGNCVVFKPASLTPLLAYRLVESLANAGIPPGVINLVTGPGNMVGEELFKSSEVDAISFTGSTDIGKRISDSISQSKKMVRVQLELGGKNAAVVLKDAKLDEAVHMIKSSAFGLTGQACTATSRLIVEEPVKDRLLKAIAEAAQMLKVGDGLQPGIEMGPAVSEEQLKKDLDFIQIGTGEGAKLVVGGRRSNSGGTVVGHFIQPTIFDDVRQDMTIAREEIFGPVLSVMSAKNADEAIEIANATSYGLTAGIYTTNLSSAFEFADKVDAGVIKVNKPTTGLEYQVPYGGFKQSSAGTFKEQGLEALDFYTRVKAVYIGY